MAKKSKDAKKAARKKVKAAARIWKSEVDAHDYDAAFDYLKQRFGNDPQGLAFVQYAVNLLRDAPLTSEKAKDIIRSSGNAFLTADDPHVQKNLEKIKARIPMSPVLLVICAAFERAMIIADGFHRVSTIYNYDYDQAVPCKMVTVRAPSLQVATFEPVTTPLLQALRFEVVTARSPQTHTGHGPLGA